eukprot:scaffold13511_cov54-Phaeocystis_antarctica.AAC.1
MERSDVYVLKPAAPQRPWEFYRNMLPDVPQQGQNAPARSSLPAPPLQRPNLVAHGYKLGPKGEPSPAQARERRDLQGGCSNLQIERMDRTTIVFTSARAKRQNKSVVNHFHQTLTYLPGSAAGCHSSTKPPVRNTSDAASRPP